MYTPNHYRAPNEAICLEFIESHPFGLLTSNGNTRPLLTHLPFVLNREQRYLNSHLAQANPHLKGIDKVACTAVFSGPNAYISTKHYASSQNVPTWNYIAVHIQGSLEVVTDFDENVALMEEYISFIDPDFMGQWRTLDHKYKTGMLNAITPFKIRIESIEGKFKMSQNKTRDEQDKIITQLEKDAPEIAKYMDQMR